MSNLLLLGAGSAGGAPTAPTSTSLLMWLDANTISTLYQDDLGTTPVAANNDPVGKWSPRSGSGYFQQGTAANKPLYKTGILNSKPGIKFDGTNDHMQHDTNLSAATMSESTVFFVISGWTSTPGAAQGLLGLLLNPPSDSYYLRVGDADKIEILEAGIASIATSTNSMSTAGAIIVTKISDTGNSYALQNKSVDEGSGAWAGSFTGNADILGAQTGASPEYFTGYIHEIMIYNAVLSAADINSNVQYLQNKWLP